MHSGMLTRCMAAWGEVTFRRVGKGSIEGLAAEIAFLEKRIAAPRQNEEK